MESGLKSWAFLTSFVCLNILAFYLYKKKRYEKSNKTVIVFTRYPSPGTTKTRLIPALGPVAAAYTQLLMTNHAVENLRKLCSRIKDVGIEIWYNGGTKEQMQHWMYPKVKSKVKLTLQKQLPGDLGEKLRGAAKSVFSHSGEYVVIIGCDIPGIDDNVIEQAFEVLSSGADMTLGPASDGGYYLVGFRRSAESYLDDIFLDIQWGTEKVFKQQSDRAKMLGIKLEVLSTVLSDVDEKEDLHVVEKELAINRSQLINFKWSIIIPTLNEEGNIIQTLENLMKQCSDVSNIQEVIISDGGSKDSTVDKVKSFASTSPVPVKVINSHPGRGYQMRTAAAEAKGDHLLFVHGDSLLPSSFDTAAMKCLQTPGNVAGAYRFGTDTIQLPHIQREGETWFFKLKMKLLELGVAGRVWKKELPYGDNGIFISKKMYEKVGGFQEVYLLEDVLLIEELWKYGHIGVADCSPIITSARRWRKSGMLRNTGLNQIILTAHALGVSPDTLARWYYGDKLKKISDGK